jgi:hypothetical protein
MAVGDVPSGSSGLGFASRSGRSARPPAGRGVAGAGAFEIVLRISPPPGDRRGRRGKRRGYRLLGVAIPILAVAEFYHEPQAFAEAKMVHRPGRVFARSRGLDARPVAAFDELAVSHPQRLFCRLGHP